MWLRYFDTWSPEVFGAAAILAYPYLVRRGLACRFGDARRGERGLPAGFDQTSELWPRARREPCESPRRDRVIAGRVPHRSRRDLVAACRRSNSRREAPFVSTITSGDTNDVFGNELGAGICELCSRSQSGLDVALLWQQSDNTAIVAVVDHCAGDAFLLDVQEDDNPLELFHHPYAYAAHRGVDFCLAPDQQLRIAA
jgi:hypothetical protein